jgi:apolipoprotein N-acyltransferase
MTLQISLLEVMNESFTSIFTKSYNIMMTQLINNKTIRALTLFLLGTICVLGFAPFYLYPASILAIIGLCFFLSECNTIKTASWSAFCFGLGLFCAGIYWIYISLHTFGGMPSWIAALATFLLSAFMASFTALTGGIAFWIALKKNQSSSTLFKADRLSLIIALAIIWGLADWTRSWIFTGFPWLTIGYTQVPNGALAGLLPIFGIYGISTLTVLVSGLLFIFVSIYFKNITLLKPLAIRCMLLALGFMIGGQLLKSIEWSTPIGEPIGTALIQGNIAQDLKWSPDTTANTIALYLDAVQKSKAKLIVLPETALPILSTQLTPDIKTILQAQALQNQGNLILGIVKYTEDTREYFNGALSFGVDAKQHYEKSHLVPFGEFIPLKQAFGWVYRDLLNMPMSDMSRGTLQQQPMHLSGQQVAINICYEDVFGEEIIRQLPAATLLVNITNDAWFGDSLAPDQHLQFSQARAIETGRMMLRATNTGATAAIDPKGQIVAYAPHFTQTTLNVSAQGYTGTTPYVRMGNWLFLLINFSCFCYLVYRKYQSAR